MPQYLEVYSKEGQQWFPCKINDWENLEEAKQKLEEGGYKVRIPDQSVYRESNPTDSQHLT